MSFEARFEREPRSGDDLFGVALDRLADAKLRVETGELSYGGVLKAAHDNKVLHEEHLQVFLAGELDRDSRRQYSVHREVEVRHRKEPDIRIAQGGVDGAVSIEVKVADSWTLPQLRRALSEQLVGRYLGSPQSGHGVLLLGYFGKSYWCTEGRKGRNSFRQVIELLQEDSSTLKELRPEIEGLAVVGIDFT